MDEKLKLEGGRTIGNAAQIVLCGVSPLFSENITVCTGAGQRQH